MSPPIIIKEVKHEEVKHEVKVQVQDIAEEMDIIQQNISDEKQAFNEMNDEQKQIYKEIRELGRQMQIREAKKRLITEENIYIIFLKKFLFELKIFTYIQKKK